MPTLPKRYADASRMLARAVATEQQLVDQRYREGDVRTLAVAIEAAAKTTSGRVGSVGIDQVVRQAAELCRRAPEPWVRPLLAPALLHAWERVSKQPPPASYDREQSCQRALFHAAVCASGSPHGLQHLLADFADPRNPILSSEYDALAGLEVHPELARDFFRAVRDNPRRYLLSRSAVAAVRSRADVLCRRFRANSLPHPFDSDLGEAEIRLSLDGRRS